MCNAWGMQVAFFIELDGGDLAMLTEPVGTGTNGPLRTQTRRALVLKVLMLVTDSSV